MPVQTEHQQRVVQFMRLAGHNVLDSPSIANLGDHKLHGELALEETLELIAGLGYMVATDDGQIHCIESLHLVPHEHGPNLVEIADGCADVRFVATCTLSMCGIADARLQRLVDLNNLSKFGPGGRRDPESGKWLKPPDHQPPDIAGELARQTAGAPWDTTLGPRDD